MLVLKEPSYVDSDKVLGENGKIHFYNSVSFFSNHLLKWEFC